MNDQIFQYCVLLRPTHEEAKAGVRAKLLSGPLTVTAHNDQEVVLMAGQSLPPEATGKMDRIEVFVRPF